MSLTIKQVMGYVVKTHQIDESGEATLDNYVREVYAKMDDWAPCTSDHQFLINFLTWANGPDWQAFLDKAEVGDVPPGTPRNTWIIRGLDDNWEVTFDKPVPQVEQGPAEWQIAKSLGEDHSDLIFDWGDDQTVIVTPDPHSQCHPDAQTMKDGRPFCTACEQFMDD